MINKAKVKAATVLLIEALGCDINDQNFKDTPRRVANMYEEILEGNKYEAEPVRFVQSSNLVIVGGIQTYGFCPHHILPVFMEVSTAYLPKGEVVGLSKLVRIVNDCTNRLVMQEEATEEIAEKIQKITKSNDVMVIMQGNHLCMQMRGVKNKNSYAITSAIKGEFSTSDALRKETLSLIMMGKK